MVSSDVPDVLSSRVWKRDLVRRFAGWALLGVVVLLAACQSSPRPAPVDARDLDPYGPDALCAYLLGIPEVGQEVFEQPVLAGTGGCVTCHSLEPDVRLVGPSLYGIATTAEGRVPDVIASNYIYLSIMEPDFYIVEGYDAGAMPDVYRDNLTEEQITNLVSYLMTLGDH